MAAMRSILRQPSLVPYLAVFGFTLTTSFAFVNTRESKPVEARTAFNTNYNYSSDGSAVAKAVAIRRKNAARVAMRHALEVEENTASVVAGGRRRRSGVVY